MAVASEAEPVIVTPDPKLPVRSLNVIKPLSLSNDTKVPETVVPDFGVSVDVFVKEDNRQVKVTVYAPKEQPPAIRIVENVQNETLSVPSIANNNTYNAVSYTHLRAHET